MRDERQAKQRAVQRAKRAEPHLRQPVLDLRRLGLLSDQARLRRGLLLLRADQAGLVRLLRDGPWIDPDAFQGDLTD